MLPAMLLRRLGPGGCVGVPGCDVCAPEPLSGKPLCDCRRLAALAPLRMPAGAAACDKQCVSGVQVYAGAHASNSHSQGQTATVKGWVQGTSRASIPQPKPQVQSSISQRQLRASPSPDRHGISALCRFSAVANDLAVSAACA